MAASDMPEAAVAAGLREIQAPYVRRVDLVEGSTIGELVARIVFAAAPHLRAQVLAEVDAALRALAEHLLERDPMGVDFGDLVDGIRHAADYLRDTLETGDHDGA